MKQQQVSAGAHDAAEHLVSASFLFVCGALCKVGPSDIAGGGN